MDVAVSSTVVESVGRATVGWASIEGLFGPVTRRLVKEEVSMNSPSVFSYIDYIAFLRDWFAARKSVEPSYSYGVFARSAGCSKAALANVINGSRSPRASTLDAFARAMELTAPERNYLGLLVELASAPDTATRLDVMKRLLAVDRYGQIRRAEATPSADIERYLAHWWIPAIREMAGLPGFRADPDWIAERMNPPITPTQAEEALTALFELDFLGRNKTGDVEVQQIRFATAERATGDAVARFHREEIPTLLAGLDVSHHAEQHVMTATITLDPAMVPEAKARLHAAVEQLATMGDAREPQSPGRVFQVAIQLLPVTTTFGETGESAE